MAKQDIVFRSTSPFCWKTDLGRAVEVKRGPHVVEVRNSMEKNGAVLSFSHEEWSAFLHGVKNDEFDL